MKRLLSFFLALLIPFCAWAESPEPTEEPSPLDQAVDYNFRRFHTRCGEVTIARDGEIVYQRSFGFADQEKTIPATPDHYYRLASVSKLVTASAVMRLVESGRWDLDENIGTYLGGDEPFFTASYHYRKVGITTRMIMTHTSCIRATGAPVTKALNIKTTYPGYFYDEKPGTKYHYSNYAVGVLGCIIEAITGKRLDDAVSELLFDPMGLDAGYHPDYLDVPENITSEVIRQYGEEIDLDNDYVFAYGSCWMKCADLCRLGMMLSNYGLYNGQQILQEDTVREMLSSQKGKGGITVDSPYGLNVQRVNIPSVLKDRMFYGHHGMIDNILCAMFFDPETRFVFSMVSVCRNPKDNQQKVYTLRQLAYNLLKETWKEFGE